ncbi:hypothetical protein Taro_005972 [Colocasia esculenta]|uniref:Uncharacterized protein n=1 Tax=Colocasia esculenta TaxID=4460 RepID=A0A843TVT1_COLES|nr:hypothetical protein [Colocasia esculenta]
MASRPTDDSVGLVSSSGDVSYVGAISFKAYGKLRRLGFIIWGPSRPTGNSVGLVSSSGDVSYVDVISFETYGKLRRPDLRETPSVWFHHLETSIILTSTASRPTNDFAGLVTPVVLTSSASRPMDDSVGLVSSSEDVGYVDAISFKIYRKFRRPGDASCVDAISFKTYGKLRRPASRPTGNSNGLVSSSGDVSYVDVISFKTHE